MPRSGPSHPHAVGGGPGPGGTSGTGEAEPRCLGERRATPGDAADLAGEPDLPDGDQAAGTALSLRPREATARATARSDAGSVMRTPPTVET